MDNKSILIDELDRFIKDECEAWSCWTIMTEDEQNEAYDGYLKLCLKAVKLSKEIETTFVRKKSAR